MKKFIKHFFLLILMFTIVSESKAGTNLVRTFHGGGSAQTQFEIPFPESFTREVLANDKLFIQLIPGIKQWKVVKQTGNSQTARCTMLMSSVMQPSTYMVQVNKVSDNEIKFKRLSGDLDDLEGNWKIAPGSKPDSTLVTYRYKVDTGMKMVPRGLMENELRRHLNETQVRVKNKVGQLYKAKQSSASIGMSHGK